MKKLMFIFGTRPELIKVYPVIKAAKDRGMDVCVVNTGQHKEMTESLIKKLDLQIDYNLGVMDKASGLSQITAFTLLGLEEVLKVEKPELILVHGDTSATLAGSLSAYYHQIKLAHIEAGLRTHNKYSPFPEEINRKLAGAITDLHFAPTEISKTNLEEEGITENVYVVGNTAIDMFKYTLEENYHHEAIPSEKMILLTIHRRENLNELESIFAAIGELANKYSDYTFVYPIHFNPIIRDIAAKNLNYTNIKIIEPLDVFDFHNFLNHAHIVITDSGGIQEEAPSLGKPVIVVRDTTERPEGVKAGTLKLVGTKKQDIIEGVSSIMDNSDEYNKMAEVKNPYGDGTTSEQILNIIESL